MSVSKIRTDIKTKLESIANIGKVNDYRRHHIDWPKIFESFVEDGKINACIIEWVDTDSEKIASGSVAIRRYHSFRIWYLYSMKDSTASAKSFEDILEEIMDEMDKTQAIGTDGARWFEPSKVVSIEEVPFSGVLVHRGQVLLSIEETGAFS